VAVVGFENRLGFEIGKCDVVLEVGKVKKRTVHSQ